jgi:hypothetical protein
MSEIEILIDNGGNAKATVTRQEGEDPACYTFQKLVNEVKGMDISNTKMDAREHGHVHAFHKER